VTFNSRELTGIKAKILSRLKNVNPDLASEFANVKLPWFAISNVAASDGEGDAAAPSATDVFVYDEIGGSFGVDATELVMAINDITSDQINVRINSPGGSVFDAIAIYNSLVKHPANVTTYVDALAASAASIIAMGGNECVMMVGSQMMIHDALGSLMGNAADFNDMADFLGKQSTNIASIYANKAGGDIEEWRARMLAETWLFAAEAVDIGLADSVYSPPADAPDDPTPVSAPPGPGEPDEPESKKDDDEPPTKNLDLEILMHKRHTLTNRGFLHAGRTRAPAPTNTVDQIDKFIKANGILVGKATNG